MFATHTIKLISYNATYCISILPFNPLLLISLFDYLFSLEQKTHVFLVLKEPYAACLKPTISDEYSPSLANVPRHRRIFVISDELTCSRRRYFRGLWILLFL